MQEEWKRSLDGADAIVFGGGIGENTPTVREQIASAFAWCGMPLDRERNQSTMDGEGLISGPGATIEMWVIPTQEGLMMALEVAEESSSGNTGSAQNSGMID